MIRNKKKIICNYCNKVFERSPSLIGSLNFCCKEHYHLFNKDKCKINVKCEVCNKEFQQYKCYSDRRQFCCDDHKKIWIQNNTYDWNCLYCGKIFQKSLYRKQGSLFCCKEHRILWKKDNGLKKIIVRCKNCKKELFLNEKYVANDNFCNKECQRIYMERIGQWIPFNQKNDWQIYNDQSNWIHQMYPFLTDDDKKLLEEKGIFNTRSNIDGLVRDHIFSRRFGFENKIFPEIVRHPQNCRLITSSDNICRHYKPDLSNYESSYEYLFYKIENYKGINWKEHERCIELIKQFRNGKIWSRYE
jgi:hypothetical protein